MLEELADNNKYNNVSQKKTGFYSDTLRPHLTNIEERLAMALLTPAERDTLTLRFDTSDLLKGDIASQANVAGGLVDRGIITVNEAREWLDYPMSDDPKANELFFAAPAASDDEGDDTNEPENENNGGAENATE